MIRTNAAVGLRAALLVAALLFGLQPSVAAAQESAPVEEQDSGHLGLSHGQKTTAAIAVAGLVVGVAAVAAYYGPGAAIVTFLAAHWAVHAIVLGGAGATYLLWPPDPKPAPAGPADGAAPPGGGTWL